MMRPILTLLTDFGTSDSYVAQLKGVVLSRCPECILVDVTHHIPPQDIRRAAQVLAETVPRFPVGTVHLAVVDPGVGTGRRIIAAEVLGQKLVLPDNGLITLLLQQISSCRFYHVCNEEYWNQPVSPTFHGRDIIAPVAAFLAAGGELINLGRPVESVFLLSECEPALRLCENSWLCQVVGSDHFGNLSLSSSDELLIALTPDRVVELSVVESPAQRARMVITYGNASPGELVLLRDSQNRLELAQVNGSAQRTLELHPLQCVEISLVSGMDELPQSQCY